MAISLKPVPILLDRERYLLYDLNAWISLGEELGLNLLAKDGWDELLSTPSLRKVRAIVWAGLLHEDESITVRQVGALLDPARLGPVVEAYTKAFQISEDAGGPKDASA